MHVIIDGYNVLLRGRRPGSVGAADLERLRAGLVQRAAAYASGRRVQVTVVFDGQAEIVVPGSAAIGAPSGGGGRSGVKQIFSRPPENADAVIKRLVQEQTQPRNVTVVTSDQPLARFVQSCGCKVLSSEEWQLKLTSAPPERATAGQAAKSGRGAAARETRGQADSLEEKHGRGPGLNLDEWLRLFGESK